MGCSEELLWDKINESWSRMSFRQRRLWDVIKIMPAKWQLRGYEPCWVVALIGPTALYYNHFENGFSHSTWTDFGTLDQYQALDVELESEVQRQIDIIDQGYDGGPRASGPFPGEYAPSMKGRSQD